MKTTLSIWISKFITMICHILGKDGTVFPGSIALKFDKKAIWKLKFPKHVIVITGSGGKGSTTKIVAHILELAGKKVVWNPKGSNIRNAMATLLLNNSKSISHRIDADIVLLEMDERYIKGTFKPGTISHLTIINIMRDQLARNGHPHLVYEDIMASVGDDTHLIINADDVILNRSKLTHKGSITTYGIEKTKYSEVTTPSYAVDGAYCPNCHAKLVYDAYHYGHLGIYKCPSCSFTRGTPNYEASDLDLTTCTFKINGKEFKIYKNAFFAAYNTLAAYAVARTIGIDEEIIERAINIDALPSETVYYEKDGRKAEILVSKNETALSYLQSLTYIKSQEGKKTIVMGFDNVSRRYSYKDLSWLWDVNFEILRDEQIDKIFLFGRFRYDFLTRLEYADIPKEKIVLVDDFNKIVDKIEKNSEGNIYVAVYFDVAEIMPGVLKENGYEEKHD